MGEVPALVKVISVLTYIGAALTVISGIVLLFGSGFLTLLFPALGALGIIGGILFIGLGVLAFFTARGLWMGKNWARIISIIGYGLGAVSSLLGVIVGSWTSIISLIIAGLLAGYLAFSKKVKEAFKKQ